MVATWYYPILFTIGTVLITISLKRLYDLVFAPEIPSKNDFATACFINLVGVAVIFACSTYLASDKLKGVPIDISSIDSSQPYWVIKDRKLQIVSNGREIRLVDFSRIIPSDLDRLNDCPGRKFLINGAIIIIDKGTPPEMK